MTATTTPRARNVLTSEPPDEPAEPSARALSGDGRLSGLSSPGPLTVARAPDGSASASARLVAARNRERFTPLSSDGCPSALANYVRGLGSLGRGGGVPIGHRLLAAGRVRTRHVGDAHAELL